MLKGILSTVTWKQSQITILSTVLNGLLGVLFYVVLARFLGPEDFGLLVVSVATLTLIADVADFGINTGVVRFVPQLLSSNKDKAFKILKLALEAKLLIWLLILLVGIPIAPIIATTIFEKDNLAQPLQLVMVGVGGALFFTLATSSLQAFQKYLSWGFVNILTNLIRLILISLLIFYNSLNLNSGLITYIILPFFGFFLATFFLPKMKIILAKGEINEGKNFFSFNVKVAIFTIIAAFSARMDTFLNAKLLSSYEVGVYGAANQLVSVVPQLIGALGLVAAPKFASFQNNTDMVNYLKKFTMMVLGFSVLGFLMMLLSGILIPLLYGNDYLATVVPFNILLLSMIIFLIASPIHNSIIYYFANPKFFIWISLGQLLIILFLGNYLISNFRTIGSAITVLVGMIFNFVISFLWLYFKIKKNK